MNVCGKFYGNPSDTFRDFLHVLTSCCYRKGQGITSIAKIHPQGTMNVCTECNRNPFSSYWGFSVWIKVLDHQSNIARAIQNNIYGTTWSLHWKKTQHLPRLSPSTVIHGWAPGLKMCLPFALKSFCISDFSQVCSAPEACNRAQPTGVRSEALKLTLYEEQPHKKIPSDHLNKINVPLELIHTHIFLK